MSFGSGADILGNVKYKVLFTIAGLIGSLLFLKVVDPLFKHRTFGRVQAVAKGDADREALLKKVVDTPAWRKFRHKTSRHNGKLVETDRQLGSNNLMNTKYSVISPNTLVRDTVSVRHENQKEFETLFDVTYSIDDHSRRKVSQGVSGDKSSSLLLLGCSFTFGVGVQDEETFSAVLQQKDPKTGVYNLGIRGAGPNDFLDDFQENPQRYEGIVGKKGAIVYTAIADQFERAICQTRCYSEESSIRLGATRTLFRINKSKYALDEQGEVVRKGTFLAADPFSSFRQLAFRSNIVTLLYRELFPYPQDSDVWLFAKMIEKIKANMSTKFSHDFYFAFFPESHIEQKDVLFRHLTDLGIAYFDFTDVRFNKVLNGRAFHPYDRHPTALGHYAYAKLLEQELAKRETAGSR